MFAGIVEISSSTVLPFLAEGCQQTYIWFLMLFPTLLVVAFFITLNYNNKVLYAPSDYKSDEGFLTINKTSQQSYFKANSIVSDAILPIETEQGGKAGE